MASGFFVSSTEPASAKSSRDRDNASRTTSDSAQASAISATARIITKMAPPPPLLSLLDEDDEERDDDPPPKLQFELKNSRKKSSAVKPTTPARVTAPTISGPAP